MRHNFDIQSDVNFRTGGFNSEYIATSFSIRIVHCFSYLNSEIWPLTANWIVCLLSSVGSRRVIEPSAQLGT